MNNYNSPGGKKNPSGGKGKKSDFFKMGGEVGHPETHHSSHTKKEMHSHGEHKKRHEKGGMHHMKGGMHTHKAHEDSDHYSEHSMMKRGGHVEETRGKNESSRSKIC